MRKKMFALCSACGICVLCALFAPPFANAQTSIHLVPCVARPEIFEEIKAAHACESDSDCVLAHFGCPYGCGSIVNKSRVEPIKKMIDSVRCIPCVYMCVRPDVILPVCRNGKCENGALDPGIVPRF